MEQNFLTPFAQLKRQKRANSVTFRPEYYTLLVYRKYGGKLQVLWTLAVRP